MCTNFTLIKQKSSILLAKRLGVEAKAFRYSADIRPGHIISIVVEREGIRRTYDAIWWLYLQQTESGLKPHRDYFSVNTNYAKLARKPEYRTSRCIIPASAFVESQNGKRPHLLEPADESAIAFGGLWREWTDKITGQATYSASIITLPGHPALTNIHQKSTPLWLPESSYELWLNPNQTDINALNHLLKPSLQTHLLATPIDKASRKQPIGETFTIDANH